MSHPLIELRKLLAPQGTAITGSVVKVDGSNIHVATTRGVVIAEKRDLTRYQPGDRVILKSGELSGKLQDEANIPTFFI